MSLPGGQMKNYLTRYWAYIPLILTIIFIPLDLIKFSNTQFWGTIVLRDVLVYAFGWQMLGCGVGHLCFGNTVAEYIGWNKDDPFQFEVGLADLGMGVLGIMCSNFNGYFWLASIVMAAIFGFGCAIGHIKQIVKNKNFNPGNAGFVLWWDIFLPITLIVFGIIYLMHQ
jgi:hypothetical protein